MAGPGHLPIAYLRGARRYVLVGYLPLINVITGVVVAGLVDHRHHASLSDLGLAWVVAVGVSFTISLELTVLVVRSVVASQRDLRAATERERLRSAFGAFVDPGLAERVMREGSDLAGEEVEVSILFLDIRNFTAFAVVTTASRVETATRETGDQVLITEDTRRRLRTQGFELDERKTVELKGKQVPVQLWAPRAHPVDLSRHDRAGASVAD